MFTSSPEVFLDNRINIWLHPRSKVRNKTTFFHRLLAKRHKSKPRDRKFYRLTQEIRHKCWSCSKFTSEYWPGFWRSEAEARPITLRPCVHGGWGGRSPPRYGIYTLARVLWRLDSFVSRHRRVTQNSWDSEIVAGWCPWFFSFALKEFSM